MKIITITDSNTPGFFYELTVDTDRPFGIENINKYEDDDNVGLWRLESFGTLRKCPSPGYEWYQKGTTDEGTSIGGYRKIEE